MTQVWHKQGCTAWTTTQ